MTTIEECIFNQYKVRLFIQELQEFSTKVVREIESQVPGRVRDLALRTIVATFQGPNFEFNFNMIPNKATCVWYFGNEVKRTVIIVNHVTDDPEYTQAIEMLNEQYQKVAKKTLDVDLLNKMWGNGPTLNQIGDINDGTQNTR